LRWLATQDHRRLILGAWGCGVFGLAPEQIAADFRDLLTSEARFVGAFNTAVFAVLDPRPDAPPFEAFRRCYGDVPPRARSS
jgi:uncharacterized protein (TIGR02452 family)